MYVDIVMTCEFNSILLSLIPVAHCPIISTVPYISLHKPVATIIPSSYIYNTATIIPSKEETPASI